MTHRPSLLLLLGTIAMLSNPVWSSESSSREKLTLLFGHDDRHPVATDKSPWNAVAQIETSEDNVCSGILIAPLWVLSAGHCFLSGHGRLQSATSVTLAGQPHDSMRPDRVLLPHELSAGLIPDGDSFIIKPEASRHDVALLHLPEPVANISPIPLWNGDMESLHQALQRKDNRVSQGGYPEDHLETLLVHEDCQISRINPLGMLEHRCDTLPGDSGLPLLIATQEGWSVVGVQSSAPEARDRKRADNLALALPTVRSQLLRWMKAG